MAASEETAGGSQTRANCCPLYHEAVELVGRRWTGAILSVLMDGPLRFSEIAAAISELSDRLLSERMKELEARGIVTRTVLAGPPLKVRYELSTMGRELEPALAELQDWARRWLGDQPGDDAADRPSDDAADHPGDHPRGAGRDRPLTAAPTAARSRGAS